MIPQTKTFFRKLNIVNLTVGKPPIHIFLGYRKSYNKVPPYRLVKIIKVLSKTVKDVQYQKYLLNLPKDVVQEKDKE